MTQKVVGDWLLHEPLGRGGQGHVFRATRADGGGGDSLALKRLRGGSAKARERFVREIEALRRISHRNVVQPVDRSAADAEQLFYVMPFEPGVKTLSELIWPSAEDAAQASSYRHDIRRCLNFVAQCGDAVGAAHKQGVIHRDLKPDNILVRTDGTPLIIDFGCCLVLDDEGLLTLTDEGIGARNFMAPECEAGIEGSTLPASDVYSLGKVLWCMASGERPFARERAAFTNKRLNKLIPDSPTAGFVVDVMLQSVRSDVNKRLPDGESLAHVCRQLAAQIDVGGYHRTFIESRCHVCWSTKVKVSSHTIGDPFRLDAFALLRGLGDNDHFAVKACTECGTILVFDKRPSSTYGETLERAEAASTS